MVGWYNIQSPTWTATLLQLGAWGGQANKNVKRLFTNIAFLHKKIVLNKSTPNDPVDLPGQIPPMGVAFTTAPRRALSSLRGLRGAPEVPPLCREKSVSRTANV